MLQSLHSLTVADPNGYPGVNIILTGTDALLEHVGAADLESLRQRVRATGHVHPLTRGEMREFVEHGLAAAGGKNASVFGPGSLELLHCYTHGVPRIGQNLCESAMGLAASRREQTVSARVIRDAAVEMHGLGNPRIRAENSRKSRKNRQSKIDSEIPTLTKVVATETDSEPTERSRAATAVAPVEVRQSGWERFDATSLAMRSDDSTQDNAQGAELIWAAFVEPEDDGLSDAPQEAAADREPTLIYDEDEYEEELEAALRANAE